jgi:hypothetical protein
MRDIAGHFDRKVGHPLQLLGIFLAEAHGRPMRAKDHNYQDIAPMS